jgi:hypothetical protein
VTEPDFTRRIDPEWAEFAMLLVKRPGMMLVDSRYGSYVAAITGFEHRHRQRQDWAFGLWVAETYGGHRNLPFWVLVFNHANGLPPNGGMPRDYADEQGEKAVHALCRMLAEYIAQGNAEA